jgi:outer membrane immunogenic protein
MKNVLLGGVALITLGFVGSASAADMPIKAPLPVYNSWTGFYVGIDVGGASSNTSMSYSQSSIGFASLDPVSVPDDNHWGMIGGFHAGYNWALTPSWVIGVEADWDKASLGNSNKINNMRFAGVPLFGFGLLESDNLNWTATARAKLGYTIGSLMFYGTGGGAWANEEHSGQIIANAPGIPAFPLQSVITSGNNSNSGWVAGGGLEFMATANWLLRVEYLHYQLGGTTRIAPCPTCVAAAFNGPSTFAWGSTTLDVLRAGLSYKF